MVMARTGRRPGATSSRTAILDAARRRFAAAGYDATSLRAVAADVGVDPAVVVHFFGSKDGLFRAAVGWPFDPAQLASEIGAPAPAALSERIARIFLGFWDDPTTRGSLLALLRSAMTRQESATMLREFAVRQLFSQVTRLVDGQHAELRVDLAAAQLIGVAVLRHALHVEPIASADQDELVAWLAPALDHFLRPGVAYDEQPA
jgi:AcrR family transcriptional regulator